MALEDLVQGGVLVNGVYVYETDVIENAIANFGHLPKRISWTHEELAHFIDNGGLYQKQVRDFVTGKFLGYYMRSGPYEGEFVGCGVESCYIFVEPEPPVIVDPPPFEKEEIGSGKAYKPLTPEDHLFQSEDIYTSLWEGTNNLFRNHMINASTGSVQDIVTGSWDYKLDVYDRDYSDECKDRAYSIVFGDYYGRGSTTFGGDSDETLTKAMYSQYRNILLRGKEKFEISGSEVDSVFIIDVPRSRFKDSIKVGSWKLNIGNWSFDTGSISSGVEVYTGSFDDLLLFDNTNDLYVDEYYLERDRPKYDEGPLSIVKSGSEGEVGQFFPTHGVFVFKADLFGQVLLTENEHAYNTYWLYAAISASAVSNSNNGFWGQGYERQFVNYYFLSAKNREFNFSNNPSFYSGSYGEISDNEIERKKPYITSIGLYNLDKELIAIGKISKPLPKYFNSEAIFNVKLRYKQKDCDEK